MAEDEKKFREKLERMGERLVTEQLKNFNTNDRRIWASKWLDEKAKERAQYFEQREDKFNEKQITISQEANEISREANRVAKRANVIAIIALLIAIPAGVIAIISLF